MNENYNIRRVGHKIADMIYDIDTDYRGDLFFIISDRLRELTQGYTAELFNQIGNMYLHHKSYRLFCAQLFLYYNFHSSLPSFTYPLSFAH